MLSMQRFVFAVNEDARNDKNNQKDHGKYELSLCKHCGYFSRKGNDSRAKFGYFASS